jgi:hypothetical protein
MIENGQLTEPIIGPQSRFTEFWGRDSWNPSMSVV